jgi:hypothetical protein
MVSIVVRINSLLSQLVNGGGRIGGGLIAWPNWTSDLKRRAHVPLTQATTVPKPLIQRINQRVLVFSCQFSENNNHFDLHREKPSPFQILARRNWHVVDSVTWTKNAIKWVFNICEQTYLFCTSRVGCAQFGFCHPEHFRVARIFSRFGSKFFNGAKKLSINWALC